jgi:hypothetical protein
MSIKAIAIKTETGTEYIFRPKRLFQQEKDRIDKELLDLEDEAKYEDGYRIRLAAVQKHAEPAKTVKGKAEPADLAAELKERTADNESVIQTAFNYLINSQTPEFRFLDE